MIKLFAVVNGRVLESLGENTTPTYTRIHYLLDGLRKFDDIDVISISYDLLPKKGLLSILYNNAVKTAVAVRSALVLIRYRPVVFFSYPHSINTVQNRSLFRLCKTLNLKIIVDIVDTVDQVEAVGTGRSALNSSSEGYYFRNASLILALNQPMWSYLRNKYGIPSNKQAIFIPNSYEEEFLKIFPDAYKSVENRFNVCYIGGITKNRGIDILVQSCKRLHEKYPCLRLYLFGSYGEGISPDMKKTIEESDFIIRKEIPRRLLLSSIKDMDLFVMPYDPKVPYMNLSSPTKLFEYIGTGKPILCTNCESLLDLKGDGIIFIRYNDRDMEKSIETLINNPDVRESISKNLIKAREDHSWSRMAEKIHKAIISL